MKLIKLKGHFYVLSDKKHVSHKIGDWVYETNNHIPVYEFSYDIDLYPLYRVIASTIKLGNLPMIDLNQLIVFALGFTAREHYPEDTPIHIAMRQTWVERYIDNIISDKNLVLNEIEDGFEINIELEMEEVWDYTTDFSEAKAGMIIHKITGCDSEIIKVIEEDGQFIPILTDGVILRDYNDYESPIYAYQNKLKPKINGSGFVNILKIS